MFRNISSGLIALALTACSPTTTSTPVENGYQAGEKLTTMFNNQPVRVGTLPSGRSYYIFRDGTTRVLVNGEAFPWVSGCKTDAISDANECQYSNIEAKFFATRTPSGEMKGFCILGHDFPGRRGAVRVDKNRAFTTDTDGCLSTNQTRALQSQLMNGQVLSVRYVEWPYDYNKDTTYRLSGSFGEIYNLTKWQNLQKKPLF
ncbi:MAG: hypothetical protein KBT76_05870 [Sulfitobacter litoralis]|nr:hypothetical protein [Sulfitobacter litoralis]MBQ0801248.1 hypothetical protein [Sulfitobacter litoralis]